MEFWIGFTLAKVKTVTLSGPENLAGEGGGGTFRTGTPSVLSCAEGGRHSTHRQSLCFLAYELVVPSIRYVKVPRYGT